MADVKRRETKRIVTSLKKLKPGFQPFDIFRELCRVCVTPVVEVLPVRDKRGKVEVLLTKRADDDVFWPGVFHMPGVVLLGTDAEGVLTDAFSRIFKGELNLAIPRNKPTFVQYSFRKEKRGMGLSLLHWCKLEGNVEVGTWFDINRLPQEIVGEVMIRKIAKHYMQSEN